MRLLFTKHVLLVIGEDLDEILAEKIPKILEKKISHEIAQTSMF
jgi:hypothetical protein